MSSLSDYAENAVLNHLFRNVALSSPATVYLALFTVAPTDAGGGTEVTGAGYARQAVTFGAPSGGAITNTSTHSFAASGGNFGSVVAGAIFDAASGGNMIAWDDFTSATVNDGDSLDFGAGDIDISLT